MAVRHADLDRPSTPSQDASDPQYSSFRSNIPSLLLLSGSFLALKLIFTSSAPPSPHPSSSSPGSALKMSRTTFLASFAVLSLTALHGTSVLKILAILWGNFILSRRLAGGQWGVAGTWMFNIVVLVANEWTGGWRYGDAWGLTTFEGAIPRWHISFNITALRLISFGIDHHWAVVEASSSSPHPPQPFPEDIALHQKDEPRSRTSVSAGPSVCEEGFPSDWIPSYNMYSPNPRLLPLPPSVNGAPRPTRCQCTTTSSSTSLTSSTRLCTSPGQLSHSTTSKARSVVLSSM